MGGLRIAVRLASASKGLVCWVLICLMAVLAGASQAAFALAPASFLLKGGELGAGSGAEWAPMLQRTHGFHCDWRMGFDNRVGYEHNHRHLEACDSPADEFDRHDRRTSDHKPAAEKVRENAQASLRREEKALDRSRCSSRGGRGRRGDRREGCSEEAPPPPFRQGGRGRQAEGGDLDQAYCGVLCLWRRAKYGHCGGDCSYYRRRYENDGYGNLPRRSRRHRGERWERADHDVLK
jgi:hypothetical protein